jgi:flagellar motor switch protein FliN/FliY
MTEEESSASSSPGSDAAPNDLLWWEQPLSFPPSSAVFLGASDTAVAGIGGRILEAAGVPVDAETGRSTYFETLMQAMSATARTLSARFGREVTCGKGEQLRHLPADTDGPFRIQVEVAGKPLCDLYLHLGSAFRSLVRPVTTDATAIEPVSAAPVATEPEQKHMDVLFDVELPVSVSFGRAQLALRDVIKLTTGSIVELNRSVTEPVEIIVNNCVIARGEVVVVDGNYGVRIDQIITRQERLRTVK